MNKTISILGCGWLGLPLATYLLDKGFKVKGSTTRVEKMQTLEQKGIEAFRIEVEEELTGVAIDEFFQSETLILNIPPGRRHSDVLMRHPKQVRSIIEKAKLGMIKRILFISSTSVYPNVNRIVDEADELAPTSNSGKALVAVEKYLRGQQTLTTTILRMSGLAGGDRKPGRFFAGKKDLPNGKAPINFVHRQDCIQVIHEIIRQEKWGSIFNVCADEHPQKKDFYTHQARKHGFELPHFLEENTDATDFKIVSNQQLKQALGYEFSFADPMDF